MLFSPGGAGGAGGAVFEAADCSVGEEANETEHVDLRLAGVFISCDEGRRCKCDGNGGDEWPTG